jgi:hypothetical protein
MAKKKNRSQSLLTRKQSGDDWGMNTTYEDWMNEPDPMLGMTDEEIQNFDWEAWAASQNNPPTDPGEPDSSGFSPDFTDSGQQTTTDQPLSLEEISYDLLGPDGLPDKNVPGVTGWREELSRRGGMGAADGSAPKSGILRRDIKKKSGSLISNRGQAKI